MTDGSENATVPAAEASSMSASSPSGNPTSLGTEGELKVLDLLIVLAKHKRLVLGLPLVVAAIAVAVALLLPKVYTGRALIMPPQQQQSSMAAALGQLGALAGVPTANLGLKNPGDLYVGILTSRTIADALIGRFKLKELYKTDTLVETRKELSNATFISAGKNGLIVVEVEDEDPQRAADLANAYIDELDKLTQTLAFTEAGQRRLFFEKQVEQAKDSLAKAELALKDTQEKTGVIQLNQQGLSTIESATMLRAQIAAKEVELASMRSYATENNPELRRVQQQLAGLRVELGKLRRGNMADSGDIFVAAANIPKLGLEYIRKLREVKYQETVLELLARQFEMAKIDEAKDSAIIQVVDRAVPPDRKSKPKRALIVILSTIVAIVVAILWAFLKEARARAEQVPLEAERLRQLRSYLGARSRQR